MRTIIFPVATLACVMVVLLTAAPASAATCSAVSGAVRVPLLELYTSEGCDSCPPTDRWIAELRRRGYAPQRVLALALHVDYWNYLGWADPYAQARFGARQRELSRRTGARVVYTPQLVFDGADYRRSVFHDDFAERVAQLAQQPPGAHIRLALTDAAAGAGLRAEIDLSNTNTRRSAAAYIALYENDLANDVRAGENRGKRLTHDFVVRELWGPFVAATTGPITITQPMRLSPDWKPQDLNVGAFVQDQTTGRTLQTLSLPFCALGR